MLASRYQGAVAALAAEHPRRQVAATLSTLQAGTNNHTLEFEMATVAAVYFHALEYGDYANVSASEEADGGADDDMSVAASRFDELLRRFGLLHLVDTEGTGLVLGESVGQCLEASCSAQTLVLNLYTTVSLPSRKCD
jgi:hypothetical protein